MFEDAEGPRPPSKKEDVFAGVLLVIVVFGGIGLAIFALTCT